MPVRIFQTSYLNARKTPIFIPVNRLGQPRYWAIIWNDLHLTHLSVSSQKKKNYAISSLYDYCDEVFKDSNLDQLLKNVDTSKIEDLLTAYFLHLTERATATRSLELKWMTCIDFVTDILERILKTEANDAQIGTHPFSSVVRLRSLYRNLHISKAKLPPIVRSLPVEVIQFVLDLLDPDSADNPFKRKQTRWTAFVAFAILLHQGLRRGELLLLTQDSIKSQFDTRRNLMISWINIEKLEHNTASDKRHSQPSIKTSDSVRQIPISPRLLSIIQSYSENYRGKPAHPFLLNTMRNTPLSHESLTAIFAKISKSLPDDILKILGDRSGKTSIEPHDLRHTCACIRLSQLLHMNIQMDEALQQMRSFFGWSKTSEMPRHYAKAVFEDRLNALWSDKIDDRINFLSHFPKHKNES